MKIKKALLPLTVVAASLSTTAQALDFNPYLFVDIGQAKVDLDDAKKELREECSHYESLGLSCSTSTSDDSMAYSFGVGFNLHRNFSLELAWYDLGSFDAKATAVDASPGGTDFGRDKIEVEAKGLGARGIGHLPLTERFNLDVMGGLAYIKTEMSWKWSQDISSFAINSTFNDSSKDFVFNLGFGASYSFTENVAVRASYVRFFDVGDKNKTGEGDIDVLSVGLTYSF